MSTEFEMLQQRYNVMWQTVERLNVSLNMLKSQNMRTFLRLSLMEIQKRSISLEDKHNSLLFKNEALKYEINALKQQLPNDAINAKVETSDCQLIDGKDVTFREDIDDKSLPLADDRWADKIFALLHANKINFTLLKHKAVFTCKEAAEFDDRLKGANCKNLFLSDKKRKNFFILSAMESTKFKINDLKKKITSQHDAIKCGKLQFGKEETLNAKLKLIKGSVTPFGVLNDEQKETVLLIDDNLMKQEYAKFHPLVNTMTISLKMSDFTELLRRLGYALYVVKID